MNLAICTKRLDIFQPDHEYQYVEYDCKIVDIYEECLRVGTVEVEKFKTHFLTIKEKE